MIVTPLMWSSLELFSKYYSHFWTYPLEWNYGQRRLILNPKSSKLLFNLIAMVTIFLGICVCLSLLISHFFGFINLLEIEALITMLCVFSAVPAFITDWLFLNYADEVCISGNYVIQLEKGVQRRKSNVEYWLGSRVWGVSSFLRGLVAQVLRFLYRADFSL